MTDEYSEGTWLFTNSQSATSVIFGWARGEPNNLGNQDCAFWDKGGRGLDDHYCYKSVNVRRVLCQIPNGRC